MYVQYRSDAKYKARVIYTRLHEEANALIHCGKYIVKSIYTRRQTCSHEKAHVFALYLASDLYCM